MLSKLPPLFYRITCALVLIALTGAAIIHSAQAGGNQNIIKAGDVLQAAVPLYALGLTLAKSDREGTRQLVKSFLLTQGSTELLKMTTQKPRPNFKFGDTKNSFPSGHTASAWSGAAFIHRRYGCYDANWECWKYSAAPYAAAAFTGYSRVQANKHDWIDVIGSIVLAETVNFFLVTKYQNENIIVTPMLGDYVGLNLMFRF
jgi:membrane-associated phospholipid phosphatase